MTSISQQYNIPLTFNPPDFFYLTPGSGYDPNQCIAFSMDSSASLAASLAKCAFSQCAESEYKQCYQQELCRNKELLDTIYLKRDKHLGAEQKLGDFERQYTFSYITTINLSLGVIGSLIFIYYMLPRGSTVS